jgi:hypothetical protein
MRKWIITKKLKKIEKLGNEVCPYFRIKWFCFFGVKGDNWLPKFSSTHEKCTSSNCIEKSHPKVLQSTCLFFYSKYQKFEQITKTVISNFKHDSISTLSTWSCFSYCVVCTIFSWIIVSKRLSNIFKSRLGKVPLLQFVYATSIHSADEKKRMSERLTRLGFVEQCVVPDGRIQFLSCVCVCLCVCVCVCVCVKCFDVDTNIRKLSISSIGSSTLWERRTVWYNHLLFDF